MEYNDIMLASLSLLIDKNGNLILEQKGVPHQSLKATLSEEFPTWDNLQKTIDATRWVDESITDLSKHILKEFGENEGVRVQERNV